MINSFSSYLELFAGLNLGYATIKGFQEAANDELFGFKETYDILENRINNLEAKLQVTDPEAFESLKLKFENSKRAHKVIVNQIISLGPGFQVLFLMTSLFCFLAILLGGFESYYNDQYPAVKTLSFLNASYILPLCGMVIYNFRRSKNPYSFFFTIFFCVATLLVAVYSVYHDCPIFLNHLIFIQDGRLLTTFIFLVIPPSSFVVFYLRRYRQARKAQSSIDQFVNEFRHHLNGFEEGFGFTVKSDTNNTNSKNEAGGRRGRKKTHHPNTDSE